MSQPIKYSWEEYISHEEQEDVWNTFLPQMKEELLQWYGMKNPSLQVVYDYYRKRVEQEWNSVVMLDWLFRKTGRPCEMDLDRTQLKAVCEFHLEGCLQRSFNNCDLYEGSYSELDHNVCQECGDSLQVGDYEKHCKYCWNYRSHST
jgi:hypothetical protein